MRQNPTVRVAELQFAVSQPLDLVAFVMDHTVMSPTKHGQVRERGGPAMRPVADVMTLAEAHAAAREATAAIPML